MDFRPERKGREDGEGKERRKDCFERRGDTTETAGDPEGITAAKPTNSGSVNIRLVVGLKFFPFIKGSFPTGELLPEAQGQQLPLTTNRRHTLVDEGKLRTEEGRTKSQKEEAKVGMKKEKQREGRGKVSRVHALPPAVVKSQPRQRLCHPSPWR